MSVLAATGEGAARWGVIGLLLISPWPNAMNAPAYAGALFALSALLLVQCCQARTVSFARLPAPGLFALAAVCFAAALAWAAMQTAPVWPAPLAHPAWAHVTEEARAPAPAPISASPGLTFDALMLLTTYGLVFAYIAREATNPRFARRVLTAVGAACCLCAVAGFALFSAGDATLTGAAKTVYRGRLTGPFVNPNLFASYLALGLVIVLAFAIASARSSRRAWLWRIESFLRSSAAPAAAGIILFAALLLTASRGGLGAALAGSAILFIYVFLKAWRSQGASVAPLAGATAIGACIAVFSADGLEGRLAHSFFGSEGREEVYRLTASMIADRPFAGHGLGAFRDALPAYYDQFCEPLRKPFLYAHSLYADGIAELGAPAALLLFAAVVLIVVQCVRGAVRRRSRDRVFCVAALGASAAIGVHGLVDNPLSLPAVALSYAAILGAGYGQSVSRSDGLPARAEAS